MGGPFCSKSLRMPLGASPARQEPSASRRQDAEGTFAVKLRSAPEDLASVVELKSL